VSKSNNTLAALLFVTCCGALPLARPAAAQGDEWKKLNQESRSLYQQGQYDRAVVVAKKALDVAEKTFGPNHPNVGASLNNLAELYRAQGQYTAAEPLYRRSLAISEQALGPDHPDVAASLNNLAGLYPQARPVRRHRAALQALAGDRGKGPRP
jgi:tetratricopeptide (TPR) repeat protein